MAPDGRFPGDGPARPAQPVDVDAAREEAAGRGFQPGLEGRSSRLTRAPETPPASIEMVDGAGTSTAKRVAVPNRWGASRLTGSDVGIDHLRMRFVNARVNRVSEQGSRTPVPRTRDSRSPIVMFVTIY